jgi:prepilin-type N-terminal cleavage/methylation domain-containing protein
MFNISLKDKALSFLLFKSSNPEIEGGFSLVEMIIAIVLISVIAVIGTNLAIGYNEQYEVGREVSNTAFAGISALDRIESELIQASSSSIVLSNNIGSGEYVTIEFPKVTGFNTTTKTPIVDLSKAIKVSLETYSNGSWSTCTNASTSNLCTLNIYVIDKTVQPATIVSGPALLADNVSSFTITALSQYTYKIKITTAKVYSDGKLVTSSFERTVYARNK